jgi:hypothetical protein
MIGASIREVNEKRMGRDDECIESCSCLYGNPCVDEYNCADSSLSSPLSLSYSPDINSYKHGDNMQYIFVNSYPLNFYLFNYTPLNQGNPCVDEYNCADWGNRAAISQANGWKGF